jgi:hypothetical protein
MTKYISQNLKDAFVTLKLELGLSFGSGNRAIIQLDSNDVTLIFSDTWILSQEILKLVERKAKRCNLFLECENVSSLKVTPTKESAIATAKKHLDPEVFQALGLE